MLLAVDIGNSSIKFGVYDGETLKAKFSIPTKRDLTANGLKVAIDGRLDLGFLGRAVNRSSAFHGAGPIQKEASQG